RGKPVSSVNNTTRQCARRQSSLGAVRIHDLRHTFAYRLRTVGVSMEDREVLLGHANHSMAGHYASADVGWFAQAGELDLEPAGNAYRAKRRNCGNAKHLDKRSRSKRNVLNCDS